MKHCPACLQTKPLDQFHRDCKAKDGHAARCALCRNAQKRVKAPFKEYNGKPAGFVKVPIELEEMPLSPITIDSVGKDLSMYKGDIETFSRVLHKLYEKQSRFFTIEFSPTRMILSYKGKPETKIIGDVTSVVEEAFTR